MPGPSELAGRVFGKARAVAKAVIEGYGGILRRLAEEHGEMSMMMKRVASSEADSDARRELFPKLRVELIAHGKAEEREFYPVLREHDEMRELATKAMEDHHHIEAMLDRLAETPMTDRGWLQGFTEMMNAVDSHVKREEEEIFPVAKRVLGRDRTKEMDERYAEVKAAELKALE